MNFLLTVTKGVSIPFSVPTDESDENKLYHNFQNYYCSFFSMAKYILIFILEINIYLLIDIIFRISQMFFVDSDYLLILFRRPTF